MPRTEKQNERIRNKRRAKILNEALYLFAKNQYKAVSIDDIAKEVGCTHSLIYHYFISKEEMFKQALLLAKENLQGLIDSSIKINCDSPKEILQTVLDRLLQGLKGNKRKEIACSLILILDLVFEENKLTDEIMPKHKRPWNMINKIIVEGQEKGEFIEGDPREYTVIINSFLRGVSLASMSINKERFIAPNAEIIMRMLVKEES